MQETIVWQRDHVRAEFTSLDPAGVDPTQVDPAAGTAPDTNLRAWCSVPCTGGRPGRPASFAARYDRAMGGLPQRAGVRLEYLPSVSDRLEICIPDDVADRDHWPLDTGRSAQPQRTPSSTRRSWRGCCTPGRRPAA